MPKDKMTSLFAFDYKDIQYTFMRKIFQSREMRYCWNHYNVNFCSYVIKRNNNNKKKE